MNYDAKDLISSRRLIDDLRTKIFLLLEKLLIIRLSSAGARACIIRLAAPSPLLAR